MNKKNAKSIFRKIFIPMFCVMLIQSCIFYFSTEISGINDFLGENARDGLSDKVSDRAGNIERLFLNDWSDMSLYANSFSQIYDKYEKQSDIPMYENSDMQEKYLLDVSGMLISMLRTNKVNGVFLILNSSQELVIPQQGQKYTNKGLCIRDYNPEAAHKGNEDLNVIRCPQSILNQLDCSTDLGWESEYTFEKGEGSNYFYTPLAKAYNSVHATSDELAYFSEVYSFPENNNEVVAYSIPLSDSQGYYYGVLGIEITVDYLNELLPKEELNEQCCEYALIKHNSGNGDSQVIMHTGSVLDNKFNCPDNIRISYVSENSFFEVTDKNGDNVCGALANIVDSNVGEQLALIGLVPENDLYHYQKNIQINLFVIVLIMLVIGVIAIFIISRFLSKPIMGLAQKVQKMKPEHGFRLERLGINEIDQLVSSIEDMSRNISENKARTEFFSRMSHDMRTPMNAIISFSSSEMLDKTNEADKDDYLEKINVAAKYLLGLINEVLDMTKIESGKMELREDNIALKSLWESNSIIISELAAEKNIEYKINVPSSGVSYIIADFQRLSQIIVNLLSNAVKFTEPGGKVEFSFIVIDTTSTTLDYCISVKDNGIGMSEEFQKRVYEPFVQGDTKQSGTGLGLAITKQIVELMGGKIECISKPGEGTEFFVYLKSRIGTGTVVNNKHHAEDNNDCLEGKRILLCEDHVINCQIATRLLKSKKIIVDVANDGKEGVEMFEASEIDYYSAILMDIRMPVMDGLAATAAIRQLDREDAETIPIIAMTADVFEDDVKGATDAGMNAHLAKPIEPNLLFSKLIEFLS